MANNVFNEALSDSLAPDKSLRISEFKTQFEYRYFDANPADVLQLNEQTGTAAQGNDAAGYAYWQTGAAAGSVIDVQSAEPLGYSARHLSLYDGSFLWLAMPTGTGQIDAGAFTDTDGFMFRAKSGGAYIVHRINGFDTEVAIGSHNGDPLDGSANSEYTLNGAPVAPDFTKYQIGQFVGSWRGADSFEVYLLTPDKKLVMAHRFSFANQTQTPSLTNPNLPMRVRIDNGDAGENLEVRSNCWSAATNVDKRVQIKTVSNSSDTPLLDGQSFVGGKIPARFYSLINGTVITDQDGQYRYHWSDDGTTDSGKYEVSQWYEYDSGDGLARLQQRRRRREYAWIEFQNNSGDDQASFYLDVYLEEVAEGLVTQPAKANIGKGDPVLPVKVYGSDKLLDYEGGGVVSVGSASVELAPSASKLVSREVQLNICGNIATAATGIKNGIHLRFAAGNAATTDAYYPVGTYTFNTDQAIKAVRGALSPVDIDVSVMVGEVRE